MIFDVPLFMLVSALAVAAIVFAVPGQVRGLLSHRSDIKAPVRLVMVGAAVQQSLIAVGLAAAGAALAPRTGLEAPLAAAAQAVFGDWGAKMLLVAGVISIYATISGDMLNTPRVVFASARDGNLPKILGRVHPKYKTPYTAIIFMSAVVCAFALSGSFEKLAVVASGSVLVIYFAVSLAVIRIRRRDGLPKPEEFRLPFGPTIPILSILIVGWLLLQLSGAEALGLAALVGASVLIYGIKLLALRAR